MVCSLKMSVSYSLLLYLNYFFKHHTSKYSHVLRDSELEFQPDMYMSFGGIQYEFGGGHNSAHGNKEAFTM